MPPRTATRKGRRGRPPKIDHPLRSTRDGATITVADEIIERVRAGATRADAAGSVGIAKSTLQLWIRDGARAATRRLQGEELDDQDQVLADFSDREAQATAEWKVEQELQLGVLSSGRTRLIETQKLDAAGNVLERTTRKEGLEPDARVIMWRLERRFPEQYGTRRLELTGPEGGPIPVSVKDAAVERLGQMAEQLAANLGAVTAAQAAPAPEEPT